MDDQSKISATNAEARQASPAEPVPPTRIVLDDVDFDRLVDLLERPSAPTSALRELMRAPLC